MKPTLPETAYQIHGLLSVTNYAQPLQNPRYNSCDRPYRQPHHPKSPPAITQHTLCADAPPYIWQNPYAHHTCRHPSTALCTYSLPARDLGPCTPKKTFSSPILRTTLPRDGASRGTRRMRLHPLHNKSTQSATYSPRPQNLPLV